MHVTIAYCGKAAAVDAKTLGEAATAAAAKCAPIAATISGHARFTGGDQDVIVALVDSPDLETLRRLVVDELAERGVEVPRDHGYTPHLTIQYIDPDDPDPIGRLAARTVPFTSLTAKHGTDVTSYPLGDIADQTAEAYAAGWALSGGPWTPRVAAGAKAAVGVAREHADDPGILEATLKIGQLEGTWATVFARREKVI